MRLYIVRHAWAGEPDAAAWPDDSERPLTDDGKKRYRKMVAELVERGFEPAVIATSPYVRCRQTADLAAAGLAKKPAVVELPALEPHSRLEELLAWTAERRESEIAWVGHMPDVALMAGALVGASGEPFDFAKGATAAIDFDDHPAFGTGRLRWFVTAKMLGV